MKLIADSDIPYLRGVFENAFHEVHYVKGDAITPLHVKDADALIIRTRTAINEHMLLNTNVKAIATATIGTDHIDIDFCASRGIAVYNAKGCNAWAVVQWVISALCQLSRAEGSELEGKTIGIVGAGSIGEPLGHVAKVMGMNIMTCDPPRKQAECRTDFVDLDTIARCCDIVTFHVPLTCTGAYPTHHLADAQFFNQLKDGAWLLNCSRGGVVDEGELLRCIDSKSIKAALDVFEGEPRVNNKLLEKLSIATPHIAGYSLEGKVNATCMVVEAISSHFGLGLGNWFPTNNPVEQKVELYIDKYLNSNKINIKDILLSVYPILNDDAALRGCADDFEQLRNTYHLRREYGGYILRSLSLNSDEVSSLRELGFRI